MSQLDPTIDLLLAAPPARVRGRYRPRLAPAATAEQEVADRAVHGRLRDPHRAHRAVDLGRAPDGFQPARRPPGAVVEPPVRDDRPGQRHLLPGRRGRPALAPARPPWPERRDRPRRDPRDHRRLRRRALRRRRQPTDQRLPRDPRDPAARRHVGLPGQPAWASWPRDRARPLGVRGAHPARAGAVARRTATSSWPRKPPASRGAASSSAS